LRKEPTDICELIYDIARDSADTIAIKNQKLDLQLPKQAVVANIDRDNIRMVFENILDNASKYSDEGSSIRIEVIAEGKQVRSIITDEGIGISPEDQKRLFQKFSRIDDSFTYSPNGSGLGLYWAKELVKLHDGDIRLSSEKGVGSTFTISLPVNVP
jgi:signal transduction histidine kinase